jgi:hypothetical protein
VALIADDRAASSEQIWCLLFREQQMVACLAYEYDGRWSNCSAPAKKPKINTTKAYSNGQPKSN